MALRKRRVSAPGNSTREIQMMIGPIGDGHFSVAVEPEAMQYDFPPHERVLLTFIVPDRQTTYFDLSHGPDFLQIWRPADTEVWATLADGERMQIGGWSDNPAPWLDTGSSLKASDAPWVWPPAPSD